MHSTVTPYLILSQSVLEGQGASLGFISIAGSVAFVLGIIAPIWALRYEQSNPVSVLAIVMLMLAGAVAFVGLGDLAVTLAGLVVVAIAPEIGAIVADAYVQERVESTSRSTSLSVVNFWESAGIACGYISLVVLQDLFGYSLGSAYFALIPLAGFVGLLLHIGQRGGRRKIGPSSPAWEHPSHSPRRIQTLNETEDIEEHE